MPAVFINPNVKARVECQPPPLDPLPFHHKLPGYDPTPLHDAGKFADRFGFGRVVVKDESHRFGLPSFKILGASWAAYKLMQKRFGIGDEDWDEVDDLKKRLRLNKLLKLITATDGNHGRGVARVAAWFGFDSGVFVPMGTVRSRIDSIISEGARVTVVEGDYDLTVEEASDFNGPVSWLIQDTAWPGNEEIPAWIQDGYSTMFFEIREQLHALQSAEPDVIFVQIGVGSLAAAVVQFYKNQQRKRTPVIIGMEPEGAACAMESVREGRRVKVHGPFSSIMTGLNCGKVSYLALPYLRDGIDAFVTVNNETAEEAVRMMADNAITSGESGAGGLAGLLTMMTDPHGNEFLRTKGIDESSTILLISTEGITDPDLYQRIMDRRKESEGRGRGGQGEVE